MRLLLAKIVLLGCSLIQLIAGAHASITTYTNRGAFLAALQPGYFDDAFTGVSFGGIQGGSSTRSGNGYSVTYSASTSTLFSPVGAIGPNTVTADLIATVSGSPTTIYAFGADFFFTDSTGDFQSFSGFNPIPAGTAVNGIDPSSVLSSGTNSLTNFYGWISTTPLTSVTMAGGSLIPDGHWAAMDNVVVGQLASTSAPEPTTLALLGLGAVALVRRRK